jgi:hypothetical protein
MLARNTALRRATFNSALRTSLLNRGFADDSSAVVTTVDGHIATITLNRPKVLNAMTVCIMSLAHKYFREL